MKHLPVFICPLIKSSDVLTFLQVRMDLARGALRLLSVLALSLSACVPHRPYWVEKPKDGKDWARSSESFEPTVPTVEATPGHSLPPGAVIPQLRVVEFDDHGDMWASKQATLTTDMIQGKNVPQGGLRPLVVVFIPGWKNNADLKNGDFKTFQKLLWHLAEQTGPRGALASYRVCGVYIGWRGDTLSAQWAWPTLGLACVARQLTIYPRMYAADRISGGLPLTALLGQVTQKTYSKKGKCVMVGHSLGARILETVMSRTLVDAPQNRPDLTLLVNPASDAQRAYQTMQTVAWDQKAAHGDYYIPAIISLRADSDSATGRIYPFAMTAGKFLRSKRYYPVETRDEQGRPVEVEPGKLDVSQKYYITHPAARIDYLRSHRVYPQKNAPGPLPASEAVFQYNLTHARREGFVISGDQGLKWWQITRDEDGSYKMYKPENKVGAYWVMALEKEVLNGHSGQPTTNGIFSDGMIELFGALYTICQPASAETQTKSYPPSPRELHLPATLLDREMKLQVTPQKLPPADGTDSPAQQAPPPSPPEAAPAASPTPDADGEAARPLLDRLFR